MMMTDRTYQLLAERKEYALGEPGRLRPNGEWVPAARIRASRPKPQKPAKPARPAELEQRLRALSRRANELARRAAQRE